MSPVCLSSTMSPVRLTSISRYAYTSVASTCSSKISLWVTQCQPTSLSEYRTLSHRYTTFPEWYPYQVVLQENGHSGDGYVRSQIRVSKDLCGATRCLRTALRYLGVPLRDKSYLFGDNESVVNSTTQPHAKLHKQNNALSFHCVREAITSGHYVFTHIPGKNNPSDILSKHWGYGQVWHMLKTLLMVVGETIN